MVAITAVHSRIRGTLQRALIFTREELLDTLPMLKQRREEGQEAGRTFGRPFVQLCGRAVVAPAELQPLETVSNHG